MTVQEDVIRAFANSRMLDVLKWAAPAAFTATGELYDENAGHGQGVVGYLNHTHLVDRIDRATSNVRYRLPDGVEGSGSDLLEAGISAEAFRAMPKIDPGAIQRSNYNQSPGWAIDGYRVLLQSYPYGKLDDIKWEQRSEAKRRVASQVFADDLALFGLEDLGSEVVSSIPDGDDFEGLTLIAAHAFNPLTGQFAFHLGQSKNPDGPRDTCWHWRILLEAGGAPGSGLSSTVPPVLPGTPASTAVDDVPVQIRARNVGGASGSSRG